MSANALFSGTITTKRKPNKTIRNPIIQAKKDAVGDELYYQTKEQLSRKLGISKASISQMLNLLKLLEELKEEIEAMGGVLE